MTPTVADIIRILETIAPPYLAEPWDNCGLQVGKRDWPVSHVRTALDPLPEVVVDAANAEVDLLVTHHPLIFKPLKQVDFGSDPGKIIRLAADRRMALYAAHTSLDKAPGGLNDILAGLLALTRTKPLIAGERQSRCKVVFFVPTAHVQVITNVLVETGAGRIGNYSGCTFRGEGVGTFIPGTGTNPYAGKHDRMNEVVEVRVEAVVDGRDLERVVSAVRAAHPYENMAYDIYPVESLDQNGLGRVGTLEADMDLATFAKYVAGKLDLPVGTRMAGDPHLAVSRVALCTGSGSSLTADFLASGADVFVSGDIHYHDARTIEAAGRGVLDIGHFASERIMVAALADRLRQALEKAGLDTTVSASEVESDPFKTLT